MQKTYVYSCFGETIQFAEFLGWSAPPEDGRTDWGDATEQDALDFIARKGFEIIIPEE
ncbi:MAG: hypothetical protein VW683_02680 [Betaproteobacteria bacterium]